MESFDAIIVGAGAAGVCCAALGGGAGEGGGLRGKGQKSGGKIPMCARGGGELTHHYFGTAGFFSPKPPFF